MSASHSWSGRSALKLRRTRSGAALPAWSRLAGERRCRERSLPHIPNCRIRRSTRLREQRIPCPALRFGPDTGRAAGAVRTLPDPGDLLLQGAVLALAFGPGPPEPGVAALTRHPRQAADRRQGVASARRLDEPEPHRRPCSRAKNDRLLQNRPLLAQGLVLLSASAAATCARWWSNPRPARRRCRPV